MPDTGLPLGTSIRQLSHGLLVVGVVALLLSMGYRYTVIESRQPNLEVGATNILRPWAKRSVVLVQDLETLRTLMYLDTEDLFLPIMTFPRTRKAMNAYDRGVKIGTVQVIDDTTGSLEAKNLDSVEWNPEYRGILLNTPRMLKVEVITGGHQGRIAWVSSHWVESDGKSGTRLQILLRTRLGLVFSIWASLFLIRTLPRAIQESLFVRRRFGSIPLTARLMMALYCFSSYMRLFFFICFLMLIYALPRAIKEMLGGNLTGPEFTFIVLFSIVAVTVIIRWTTPPTVVVLGRSTTENVRGFLCLESVLAPAKISCLLTGVNMSLAEARKLAPRGLRLAKSPHWRLIVTHLLDMAPAIVFLDGEPTPQVEEEHEYVLGNGYERKCVHVEAASPERGVERIWEVIDASSVRTISDGHNKAWVWIRHILWMHASGMKDILKAITEGQKLMRLLQRELNGETGGPNSDLERLSDFPRVAIEDNRMGHLFPRGLWLVRCICRGVIDELQKKRIHQPQYLAICYGELARVELLTGNKKRSGEWAREALGIITTELAKVGDHRLSDREVAELGSIHLCLAESEAGDTAPGVGGQFRQEALREYTAAISSYETLGVSTRCIRDRMALLERPRWEDNRDPEH